MIANAGPAERRSLPYLIAAAAAVVIVAVLVGIFGVTHPPAVPALDDAALAPPAGVAWTAWDDREDCASLYVARPDGETSRVTCASSLGDVVGWTDDGIVLLDWSGSFPKLVTRDPATGEILASERSDAGEVAPWDTAVYTERHDGTLVVLLEPSRREVWRVDAQAGYEIRTGSLSPDRDWVAMVDSAGRLLVVSVGGGGPYVWADGVPESAWSPPVWEGTVPHTVDAPKY